MGVALVTGATGQAGRYLVQALSSRGDRVVGIARGKAAIGLPDIEFVRGDVEDPALVARVVSETEPAEIYHLAGQTSVGASFAEPAATFRSVALGTLHVLEAARCAVRAPRVYLASSAEVFGDLGGGAAREDTPFRPMSPYGAAKAAASELARSYRKAYDLHVCVAFLYNHESPLRSQSFVTKKIVRAACRIARGASERLELGDTSVVRDWGWAPEYADAAMRVLAHDTPDDYVIATGTSCSLREFVNYVFSALGLEAAEHVTSNPALLRRAEIPVMRADPTRAAENLGWRAIQRAEDVARLLVEAELLELEGRST
jgi:GDPmannose 4,6-dehydratase